MIRATVLFGSSERCSLRVEGAGVRPIHGIIQVHDGTPQVRAVQVTVRALNGPLHVIRTVDGHRVRQLVRQDASLVVVRGDVIIVGTVDLPVT
jgi:hypothetical protein